MKRKLLLASISVAGIALVGSAWEVAWSQVNTASNQEVNIIADLKALSCYAFKLHCVGSRGDSGSPRRGYRGERGAPGAGERI